MELFLETVKGGHRHPLQGHAAGLAGRGLGRGALDDGRSAPRGADPGGLRPIAVPAARRSDQLPDVPTFAQAGGPAFEAAAWQGVVAPAGTPEPVIRKLSQAIETAARAEVVKQLKLQGMEPTGSTPEAFSAMRGRSTSAGAR